MEKRIELEKRGRSSDQIKDLNLDNCRSANITGLDSSFVNLEVLSMINIGLTSLKGFPKLPKLRRLELSDNRIANGLNHLSGSSKLVYLNLSGNRLKDLDSLEPLKELKSLEVLDLYTCEVTEKENYREHVFNLIPNLNYLDGYDRNGREMEDDEEEDVDDDGEFDENESENENGENGLDDDGDVDEDVSDADDDDDDDEDDDEDDEEVDEDDDDLDDAVDLRYLAQDKIDEEDEEVEDFVPGDDDEDDEALLDEEEGEDDEAQATDNTAPTTTKGEKRKSPDGDESVD